MKREGGAVELTRSAAVFPAAAQAGTAAEGSGPCARRCMPCTAPGAGHFSRRSMLCNFPPSLPKCMQDAHPAWQRLTSPAWRSSGMTSAFSSSSQSRATWRLIRGTPIRPAISAPPMAAAGAGLGRKGGKVFGSGELPRVGTAHSTASAGVISSVSSRVPRLPSALDCYSPGARCPPKNRARTPAQHAASACKRHVQRALTKAGRDPGIFALGHLASQLGALQRWGGDAWGADVQAGAQQLGCRLHSASACCLIRTTLNPPPTSQWQPAVLWSPCAGLRWAVVPDTHLLDDVKAANVHGDEGEQGQHVQRQGVAVLAAQHCGGGGRGGGGRRRGGWATVWYLPCICQSSTQWHGHVRPSPAGTSCSCSAAAMLRAGPAIGLQA